ncbi:MAG TPA: M20/M25/M40 family metallo-hydrolase [Candidatus Acidoferrales bacterium]|nr:M20/M25/M40 family metallo-hydrolase [Candidatus Acidoferrales bacterium]
MAQGNEPGVGRILVGAAIWAAIMVLTIEGLQPPAPKPSKAPATEFSAGRALTVLNRLIGDGMPHPVGSEANDAVRGRIVEELKNLGYQPEIQNAFECNQYGACATVNNVVTYLKGTAVSAAGAPDDPVGKPAVLLAAHYDSVAAGPGVSDDGAGVAAVLEIARALKSLPRPRHSIVILLDDGEEPGLLGARAFVDYHPWAKDVRAAVNIDARGTSGPSLLFETGSANEWAVRLYAHHATRPATSSIFYTAYKQLPNDTDFTIFKSASYQGLNFAMIDNVAQYHTPLDNMANVNAASLQHQGDNALPALVAIANSDLSNLPQGDAVYFDIFQRETVRWPSRWTLPLAIVVALLVFFQIAWLGRNKRLARHEFLWGLAAWFAIIAVTGILALALKTLIQLAGAMLVNWVAHPVPVEIAFWSLAIAVALTLGILFAHRTGLWGLWAGVWTWWTLLSIVVAWKANGISYVLLVPAGVAVLAALPFTLRRNETIESAAASLSGFLPLATAAIVGIPPALLLYDGLGNRAVPLIAMLVALLVTPLVPLCRDLLNVSGSRGAAFFWIPLAVTVLATFATVVAPGYSAKAPERANIQYWKDADTGKSQWIVQPASGRLPEPIRVAATFQRAGKGPFPWEAGPAYLSEAPRLDLSPPTLTIIESYENNGKRTYRTLLRSERGAPLAMILFPPGADVQAVRVQGYPVEPETERVRRYFGGWQVYRCLTMLPEGIEIGFTLPVGKPVEVFATDITYRLPPEGKFLLNARPLTVTPSQDGDVTMVSRRVQLIP